jgi:prepilin-type N-terminal cleavage/methylation domain-containing protein
MTRRHSQPGFTLLEVMLAVAILGFALAVLAKGAASSMHGAVDAQMMSVATDLSRGKMHDIEEQLLKDGFNDTDQAEGECGEPTSFTGSSTKSTTKYLPEGDTKDLIVEKSLDERDAAIRRRMLSGKTFEEEGWPKLRYTYRIEVVELPSWDDLQNMSQQQHNGSGSGSGSGGSGDEGGFQNSTLGGMLSQLGGGFGGSGGTQDIDSKAGASFVQSQYQMVQEVLKVSIRKVTLCVYYDIGSQPYEMKTVAYYTDASAMDKVLMGLGSKDLDDAGSGSGSGSGRGSGSGSGSGSGGTRPPPVRPGGGGSGK